MKSFNRQFNRVLTGDIHGDVFDLEERIAKIGDASKDDLLIILGDVAFFYSVYHGEIRNDEKRREYAAQLPITLLCIQGNHEQPFREIKAKEIELLGGKGFKRDRIYFADNGTVLDINGKKSLVIGGAYSVDKPVRLLRGYAWWENEELSDNEFEELFKQVKNQKFDWVFTHTCPYNFMPKEMFLAGIDQSQIKNRTEKYLQKIHDNIEFAKWCCGHFHTDKLDGKIEFFYKSLKQLI